MSQKSEKIQRSIDLDRLRAEFPGGLPSENLDAIDRILAEEHGGTVPEVTPEPDTEEGLTTEQLAELGDALDRALSKLPPEAELSAAYDQAMAGKDTPGAICIDGVWHRPDSPEVAAFANMVTEARGVSDPMHVVDLNKIHPDEYPF